jgi:hypothetical protein
VSRHIARDALPRYLIEFGAGEEEGTDAVHIAGRRFEFAGFSADGLDGTEAAIGIDVREHALPGFHDDGEIFFAVEETVMDSPCETVGEEGSAGDFRIGVRGGIEETGAPYSVRARRELSGTCRGRRTTTRDSFRDRRDGR